MNRKIDFDAVMAAIPGENPAGEDLRYVRVYEDIKEARKSEDSFALGEWQREVKTADWDKVISLAVDALTGRTKDLQIAAWLTEALAVTDGFEGIEFGFRIIAGFLDTYWDSVYPLIEDDDYEFRLAPFDFLNDKLVISIRQVPLTDKRSTAGYSLLKWQESRDVGSESDTKNSYGDLDEQKKRRRDELIAEGKITAETFDAAVAQTPKSFALALCESIAKCLDAFNLIDKVADERFGKEAPRLSDLGQTIEECLRVARRLYPEAAGGGGAEAQAQQVAVIRDEPVPKQEQEQEAVQTEIQTLQQTSGSGVKSEDPRLRPVPMVTDDTESAETALWNLALRTLEQGGFKGALDLLLAASHQAASARDRNRYRLMMVKICLKTGRTDLARPIIEELNAMIDELHLEQWESPVWIAEVLEAYYLCLQGDDPSDDDVVKSRELFRKICALDVTKAIVYRK